MPRQLPTTLRPRISRSSPRRKPPPSRSKSAAAVPDINAPSRTVRPPFRLFDPFSARLHRFQPNGFQGPRSYLCRHRVQSRRADILSHICTGGARACANFFGKLCAMFYSAPAGKRSPLGTSPGNRRRDLCDSANWITDWIPSNFFGAAPTANLSMVLSPARNRR